MKRVRSSRSPIMTPIYRQIGPCTLSIYQVGSSVSVLVSNPDVFASLPLASMEINQNGRITMSRYSATQVALEEQLEMEIAHVPRVRL